MLFGRLTWLGIAVALAGWAVLVLPAGLAAAGLDPGEAALLARAELRPGVVGPCLIGSGFAVALLGALQTGFGALDRFFAAALHRSAQGRAVATGSVEVSGPPREIVQRGLMRGRLYVTYSDGSVEVETLLGRRVFPSLAEAQSFVGV